MAKKLDEQEIAVARVYARSLLQLAEAGGAADEVGDELAELRRAAEANAELAGFLGDPLVEADARRSALETMFRGRASDLVVDTLQVMSRKGRLQLVPALAEAYRQELEGRRGRVEVQVTTPVPLTEDARARLSDAVSRHTGREARLAESVDETLIGGMVLRVGDRKIDTSVAKELSRLGSRLLERASAEIQAGKAYFAEAESAD